MAHSLTSNLSNLTGDLQEAFMDGFISDGVDLSPFIVQTTDKNTITNVGVNPPSGYLTVTEGADIATKAVEESHAATYSMINKALGFAVSEQTKLTMPREMLLGFLGQLGAAAQRLFADVCYDILNNATSTNGPDGVPLASASHPSAAGNQSNTAAGALDFAAYEAGQRNIMTQQTNDGMLAGYRADLLVVPAALNVTAFQVNAPGAGQPTLGTSAAANLVGAFAVPNYSATQGIRTVVSADLSSDTQWHLMDSRFSRLRCYVLKGPAPMLQESDPDSGRLEVRDRIILATGFDSFRAVFVGT